MKNTRRVSAGEDGPHAVWKDETNIIVRDREEAMRKIIKSTISIAEEANNQGLLRP